MDNKFSHIPLRHLCTLLVYDLCLPVVARLSDSPHLMYILHAKMHTARAYGFAQAIVCVILMMRKMLFPSLDQAGRNRLGPNVHQAPLLKQIMVHIHFAGVDGIQKILRPWHQKPDDGTLFLCNRP